MLGWEKEFNLGKVVKKVVILLVFLFSVPVVLPHFGIDVINDCSTYTLSDYEAAKSNPHKTIENLDIGKCKGGDSAPDNEPTCIVDDAGETQCIPTYSSDKRFQGHIPCVQYYDCNINFHNFRI